MRNHHAALLLIVSGLFAPLAAQAQDNQPFQVEVWAVRATTKNKDVAPELRELAKSLQKQFKYTGFKLERRTSERAEPGKPFTTTLIEGYEVKITPQGRADGDKQVKLDIEVTKREGQKRTSVLKCTVTNRAGTLVPYGCGSLANDDYLIMAIRAR
jgi:hypothetical protein